MRLSIVTTLYRSAETIDAFYERALAAATAITADVEIVMVNDGSPDDSIERALALHAADPRVVVVDLSRNFGHHKAMMTGLSHATGELVFLIDSDLEEEPELLTMFYARFQQGDCDVVYGVQQTRRGGRLEQLSGEIFFKLAEWLSREKVPRNNIAARLMTRAYVNAVVRHRDREFLISNLFALAGYHQVELRVQKLSLSPSSYSLSMRMEMAVKYITTTSPALLYLLLYVGVLISGLSALMIVYLIARYLMSGIGVSGYTSIIVSVWFFGGLTTLMLGLISVYIAAILSETKRRPYVVVRGVHRRDAAQNADRKMD